MPENLYKSDFSPQNSILSPFFAVFPLRMRRNALISTSGLRGVRNAIFIFGSVAVRFSPKTAGSVRNGFQKTDPRIGSVSVYYTHA